jgi:ABC-2 type transport system permease protein
VINKEFIQLRRDMRSVFVIVFIPVFLLIIFGYGVTLDIKNISLVVCDYDRTSVSRAFIERFTSSDFFTLSGEVDDIRKIDGYLISGMARVALILPHNFSEEVELGHQVKIQVIIDGVDANMASVVLGYVQQIVQGFSFDLIVDYLKLKPRVWFNEELKSVNFFIPGLMGLIMMILTVLMTALSISRERELGSFEKLMSTPLSSWHIIIGKSFPYAILALFDSILILITGYILFGLEVKGDLVTLFVITLIFITCGLNIGLIISMTARSQQATMAMAFLSTIVPTFILSGFVFPIRNMPVILQFISFFVPARYYLEIIRGIILKGSDIFDFSFSVLILSLFTIVTFIVGAIKLRKIMREV